jgi:hypothetical protein
MMMNRAQISAKNKKRNRRKNTRTVDGVDQVQDDYSKPVSAAAGGSHNSDEIDEEMKDQDDDVFGQMGMK